VTHVDACLGRVQHKALETRCDAYIRAKPSPPLLMWDMMEEKNVRHLPPSATITKSGRLSRSPERYGHYEIRTPAQPIARLQQYRLPPVVQDDISYPSKNKNSQVQSHEDNLATEARPWSEEENVSDNHLCVVVVR
jgi:hypothetical protein